MIMRFCDQGPQKLIQIYNWMSEFRPQKTNLYFPSLFTIYIEMKTIWHVYYFTLTFVECLSLGKW